MKLFLQAVISLSAVSMASSLLDSTSLVTAPLFDVASSRTGSAANVSAGNSSQPITFSEFPVATRITNQYESKGIVFGPEGATIVNDKSTLTSPVLSGVPKYSGPISGYFVDSNTGKNITIKSFTFSAGYFDEVASTRVSWFDPDGKVIGQAINQRNGVETIVATGGNIASFRIGVILNEPNGFAIDNFASNLATSGVLFREAAKGSKDGSWGSNSLTLPGFDHVALNYMGSIYESHPGYKGGPLYVSSDGKESTSVEPVSGVQTEHTLGTFKHSSGKPKTSIVDFQEIAVEDSQALSMSSFITSKMRTAGFVTFDSFNDAPPQPDIQKGRNNSFTGCGLVEWAAERAKVNRGEGFVPNKLESIMLRNDTFTLLSPQLMYFAMQNQAIVNTASQFIKGFFRRVDFVLTDPLGRRVGFYKAKSYAEIPTLFSTPDGDLEFLILFNPLPGDYVLNAYGIAASKGLAALSVEGSQSFVARTSNSTEDVCILRVPVITGSRGDVNNDGTINSSDIDELKEKIPVFTNGFLNPGDINGDGVLDTKDVDLLTAYLNRTILAPIAPSTLTKSPLSFPTIPSSPIVKPSQTKAPRLSPARVPFNQPPPTATSVPMNPTISSPLMPFPTSSPMNPPTPTISFPFTSPSKSPLIVPSSPVTRAPKVAPSRRPISTAPQILSPVFPTIPSTFVPPVPPSLMPPLNAPSKVPVLAPVDATSKSPSVRTPTETPSASPTTPHVAPDSNCLQLVVCKGGLFFKYYKMHKTISFLGRKKCVEKCVFRSKIRKKQRLGWDCGFCV